MTLAGDQKASPILDLTMFVTEEHYTVVKGHFFLKFGSDLIMLENNPMINANYFSLSSIELLYFQLHSFTSHKCNCCLQKRRF